MKNKKVWIIKSVWTVLLLAFLLSVWPGYFINIEAVLGKTDLSGEKLVADIQEEAQVSQYFRPQQTHLAGIKFAIGFDDVETGEKRIVFMLCKEDGEVMKSQEILLSEISSGGYYEVEINKRVNRKEIYYWTIILPSDFECKVIYTDIAAAKAPENMALFVNGQMYPETAQAISEYEYYVHPDKADILGKYWISAILIYLVGLEIINRINASVMHDEYRSV